VTDTQGPASRAQRRPAVFLDRDGTLVEERDYLDDPADVELVPGAADAIRRLRVNGFLIVVITNQSGIARGLYREEDYQAVRERLQELLEREGAGLDATYHCPHHPDFTGPCDCRKPGPGMYRSAERELGIDLEVSWFVGDKLTDVDPARRLGGTGVLVLTGYGRESRNYVASDVRVVKDLPAAADLIIAQGSQAGR
jgi:D-glycero-D-manno-heptose 1,7-bisphosphate phosphatase